MNDEDSYISPEDILESLADPVFTVDNTLKITSFNKGAENISGLSRQQALGQPCDTIFRSTLCHHNCPLKKTLAKGNSTLVSGVFITNHHGEQVPVHVSAALLRNCKNKVIGGVGTFQDLRLLNGDVDSMEQAVQACEAQTILTALHKNNNNRAAAARDLGIHKSTFFRKIKNLGIDLPQAAGRFRSGASPGNSSP
ncbi:MAG: PAS domain-containing protein [Thermodesulfobacteriota bacterium]